MKEKLIATREVSQILGILEKEVIDMAEAKLIPHFKVAGEFLRFKKEDVLRVKPKIKKMYNLPEKKIRYIEELREFIYFNDFYIISITIIVVLIWVILKDFLGTV